MGKSFAILALLLFLSSAFADNFVYKMAIDGTDDGQEPSNMFESAMSLAYGGGMLYVADPQKGTIYVLEGSRVERKITILEGQTSRNKMEIWLEGETLFYTEPDLGNAKYYTGSRTEVARPEGKNYDNPTGICADNDVIYITDESQNELYRYNKTTRMMIDVMGRTGNTNYEFRSPSGVVVAHDLVYIVDTGNSRIQVFTKNLTYYDTIGGGRGGINLDAPMGIFVSDKIYVADTGNNRVVVFNPDGYPVATLGGGNETRKYYQLDEPMDVLVQDNDLYVANENGTVYVYEMDLPATSNPALLAKITSVNASLHAYGSLLAEARKVGVNASTNAGSLVSAAYSFYLEYRYLDADEQVVRANTTILNDTYGLEGGIRTAVSARIGAARAALSNIDFSKANATALAKKADVEKKLADSEKALRDREFADAIGLALSAGTDADALAVAVMGGVNAQAAAEQAAKTAAVQGRLDELQAEFSALMANASAKNVSLQSTTIDSLMLRAQQELDASNSDDANDTISLAYVELDSLKSQFTQGSATVAQISAASKSIADAEKEVNQSASAGMILHPDMTRARELLTQAKSKLDSDPQGAKALAEQAKEEAAKQVQENEKMNLGAIVVGAVVVGVLVALGIAILLGGGAAFWFFKGRRRGL